MYLKSTVGQGWGERVKNDLTVTLTVFALRCYLSQYLSISVYGHRPVLVIASQWTMQHVVEPVPCNCSRFPRTNYYDAATPDCQAGFF